MIERFVETAGLDPPKAIFGRDELGAAKDESEPLLSFVREADARRVVVVGDGESDRRLAERLEAELVSVSLPVWTPPLVSIIVRCHDYGRFLPDAIESALGQTYPNCEIIVLDDGSTDDSLEIARSYGDKVRVLTHPNMGVERTSNRGVAEAKGEQRRSSTPTTCLSPPTWRSSTTRSVARPRPRSRTAACACSARRSG